MLPTTPPSPYHTAGVSSKVAKIVYNMRVVVDYLCSRKFTVRMAGPTYSREHDINMKPSNQQVWESWRMKTHATIRSQRLVHRAAGSSAITLNSAVDPNRLISGHANCECLCGCSELAGLSSWLYSPTCFATAHLDRVTRLPEPCRRGRKMG